MYAKLLFICLLVLPQFAAATSYTLQITEQELQQKVTRELPIEREAAYLAAKIYDSQVDLIEGTNEVGLFTKIDLVALGSIKGSGQAYVKGGVTYNPEKGAFYLINPSIVSVDINDMPPEFIPEIKRIALLSLEQAVQIYPLYKFQDEKIQEKMAKSVVESIRVEKQTMLIKMKLL
ncbi:MAG: DUF1439 domain-containing protein [Psychromonas sp.]